MQSLTGRGGLLHGPRLVIVLVAITVLFFILSSRSTPASSVVPSQYEGQRPGASRGGSQPTADDLAPPSDIEEPGSFSDKLFDYLKGKGHSADRTKSPATVPHAEHAPSAAASPKTPTWSDETAQSAPQEDEDPLCSHLSKRDDLLLVVWTPAPDLYTQLPSQFLTTLRCVDFVLFSTVTQMIGGHQVYNALENITDSTKDEEKDFELYNKIQTAQRAHLDLSTFKEDNEHNLDKWGVIPSLFAAYAMHPEKKWFMFIESDTYVSMSNLLPWISKLDGSKPIFAGAQVMIGDVELAHGGSGILISNPALEAIYDMARRKGFTHSWEYQVSKNCCGDKVLADLFHEAGIRLTRSFPLIQGETPFSLDWGKHHWCKAAVTWHRMKPAIIDTLWTFERNWSTTNAISSDYSKAESYQPILFRDLFQSLLLPVISSSPNISNWDNLASSLEYTDSSGSGQFAHMTFDSCRAACDLRDECLQFAWEPNRCRLGNVVHLGESVDADKRMSSGWVLRRVERYGQQVVGDCASENPFVEAQISEGFVGKHESLLIDTSPVGTHHGNDQPSGKATSTSTGESQTESEKAELNI